VDEAGHGASILAGGPEAATGRYHAAVTDRLAAPPLTLTAAGSGREVKLDAIGAPALLICFANETKDGIEAVEATARERYPEASDLLVCHVVNLEKIPGMFHSIARGMMASEYDKAAVTVPAGQRAEDYAVILPDWDGAACRALGLADVTKTLAVVLIDAAGRIVGSYQADDPVAGTGDLLAALMA
jgi:hypothetical protein